MILRLKYIMFLVVLGMAGFFTGATAQQQESEKFFVYIQNENGSPFYVREKNNTVLSSSHAGYIIIPQLSKGNYVFTIGLPGDQVAEASFDINLSGEGDRGLLLREGNGQVALYSLKDFKEIQPIAVASAPGNRIVNVPLPPSPPVTNQPPVEQQAVVSTEANQAAAPAVSSQDTSGTDSFTRMLDKIMGTKKKPAVATVPPQSSQTGNPGSVPNPPSNGNDTNVAQGVNTGTTITNNAANNPLPSASPSAPNNGLQFINFLADSAKRNSMPQSQVTTNEAASASLPVSSPSVQATFPTANNKDTSTQMAVGNSDCQQLASEDFFQKVRRKMASKSDDEGMYRIAQKYFSGGTCFSTDQIQSLTYLFITDEYKYKFLEMAYPHTYDSSHFPLLIKTLGSDYYRGRFKAMVR